MTRVPIVLIQRTIGASIESKLDMHGWALLVPAAMAARIKLHHNLPRTVPAASLRLLVAISAQLNEEQLSCQHSGASILRKVLSNCSLQHVFQHIAGDQLDESAAELAAFAMASSTVVSVSLPPLAMHLISPAL